MSADKAKSLVGSPGKLLHGETTDKILAAFFTVYGEMGHGFLETVYSRVADAISKEHESQLLNYLKATHLEVGLLLNFGPRPTFKRLVMTNARKSARSRY